MKNSTHKPTKPTKSTKSTQKNTAKKARDEDFDDAFEQEPIDESFMNALVDKAIAFAKEAHSGQLRDDGSPYYGHVERVANRVRLHSDTQAYITALLHDVLEDTACTYQTIAKTFTEEIANDVKTLTKDGQIDFESYMKRIVIKYVPFYIKLIDRLDNMQSLAQCGSDEKIMRYKNETRQVFIPIAKAARYANLPEFAQLIAEIEKYL